MSAFKINGQSSTTPVGCIIAYMGAVAPEGWILCDGVQRTNGQDGRYNNLIAAKIGRGTVNANYTPPNLMNQMLRGASSSIGTVSGSDTVTLTTDILPSHGHGVTDPGHGHLIKDQGHGHTATTTMTNDVYWCNSDVDDVRGGVTWNHNNVVDKYKTTIANNVSNVSCNKNTVGSITVSDAGKVRVSPFDIIPEYTNVNFIVKY